MSRKKIFYCHHKFDGIAYYWDDKYNFIAQVGISPYCDFHETNVLPKKLMKHLNVTFVEWDMPKDLSNDVSLYYDKGDRDAFKDVIKPYIIKNTMNPNQTSLF